MKKSDRSTQVYNTSRECRQALTTSQRLQISFVEIGDEHIFKLKIQKGTWSYLLSIGDRESHFYFYIFMFSFLMYTWCVQLYIYRIIK